MIFLYPDYRLKNVSRTSVSSTFYCLGRTHTSRYTGTRKILRKKIQGRELPERPNPVGSPFLQRRTSYAFQHQVPSGDQISTLAHPPPSCPIPTPKDQLVRSPKPDVNESRTYFSVFLSLSPQCPDSDTPNVPPGRPRLKNLSSHVQQKE